MIMQKRLSKFLDSPRSKATPHIDFQVCKSMSHFNWFARYDAQNEENQSLEARPKQPQNQSLYYLRVRTVDGNSISHLMPSTKDVTGQNGYSFVADRQYKHPCRHD